VVAHAPKRVEAGGRVIGAFWKIDLTGAEKVADAVEARPSVHIVQVVGAGVEGPEGLAARLRAPAQEFVEGLLPGLRVQAGRIGQDAVEIEEHGVEPIPGDVLCDAITQARFPPVG